jgi:hypothetical protein
MSKKNTDLFETIKCEFEIIKSCETIGGALRHLPCLFERIKKIPKADVLIWILQDELDKQNQNAFENLQLAVDWIHNKLNLIKEKWNNNEPFLKRINRLLEFNLINLGDGSYCSILLYEFREISCETIKYADNHSIFNGWAKIIQLPPKEYKFIKNKIDGSIESVPKVFGDFCISEFIFPECIEKELKKPTLEDEIYSWKEKMDCSLLELFKFLTILSKYDSFVPLKIDPASATWVSPKSLQEIENIHYQSCIGYYLSCFKTSDLTVHPLNFDEMINLIQKFLFMLEKKIESAMDSFELNKQNINKSHWRTQRCNDDLKVLIPFAKDFWKQELPKYEYPMRINREEMANKLIEQLPKNISLYAKDEKIIPRARNALKISDPRNFENGKFLGLKPHWEEFKWVF